MSSESYQFIINNLIPCQPEMVIVLTGMLPDRLKFFSDLSALFKKQVSVCLGDFRNWQTDKVDGTWITFGQDQTLSRNPFPCTGRWSRSICDKSGRMSDPSTYSINSFGQLFYIPIGLSAAGTLPVSQTTAPEEECNPGVVSQSALFLIRFAAIL